MDIKFMVTSYAGLGGIGIMVTPYQSPVGCACFDQFQMPCPPHEGLVQCSLSCNLPRQFTGFHRLLL